MKNNYPRVLVISHNLLDYSNNIGKTLLSLLDGWPKECLYSVYLRNEMPQNYRCNGYYLITDKDVLKGLLTLGLYKPGIILGSEKSEVSCNSQAESALYRLGNKRKAYVSFLRDVLWKFGTWKTSTFESWLKSVNPDIILFVPNDYELAYNVLFYVKKKVDARVVTYYMDDAFYYKQNTTGLNRIRRKRLLKCGYKCTKISEELFTICDMMSNEYEQLFNTKCVQFGNSVKIVENSQSAITNNDVVVISYIGNLHSNRWKSILEIAQTLQDINKKQGCNYAIDVYSASSLDTSILNAMNSCPAIRFHGAIGYAEVRKVQEQSDILVHVEAFDKKSVASTRLSISTKIFEYLAVQKPILAYGPYGIASMDYLRKSGAAICCSCSDDLENALSTLLFSTEKRNALSLNAKEYVIQNCDPDKQNIRFRKELLEIVN